MLSFDQTMNEEEENEPANDQAKTTKLTDFDKNAILEAVKNCPCLWKSGESWAIFIFKNIALQVARKIAPCNMAFKQI